MQLLQTGLYEQDSINYICLFHTKKGHQDIPKSNFLVDIPAGYSHIASGQKVWYYPVSDLKKIYITNGVCTPVVIYSSAIK